MNLIRTMLFQFKHTKRKYETIFFIETLILIGFSNSIVVHNQLLISFDTALVCNKI